MIRTAIASSNSVLISIQMRRAITSAQEVAIGPGSKGTTMKQRGQDAATSTSDMVPQSIQMRRAMTGAQEDATGPGIGENSKKHRCQDASSTEL